ncbi:MAG: hypothetical protein KC736_03195 [Candidatus Moranbacteria bacterium]|nr:hypothetical protein [Candidatus Moranbacteria bacterium]
MSLESFSYLNSHHEKESSLDRRRVWEVLEERLCKMSQEVNERVLSNLFDRRKIASIVDNECRIIPRSYLKKNGGPYGKEVDGDIRGDELSVHNYEFSFSGAREEWARKHYGTYDEDEIVSRWKNAELLCDDMLAETATALILHRFLFDRYVVVRSCAYDDYENGVDMLIVDTQTDTVVCAFDEVVDHVDGELYQKKVRRSKERLIKQGGMRIKYGLQTVVDSDSGAQFVRGSLPHVPGLCVSQTRQELHTFFRSLSDGKTEPSSSEVLYFRSIVDRLSVQVESLSSHMSEHHKAGIDVFLIECQQRLGSL